MVKECPMGTCKGKGKNIKLVNETDRYTAYSCLLCGCTWTEEKPKDL
jgi:hypothetical protein